MKGGDYTAYNTKEYTSRRSTLVSRSGNSLKRSLLKKIDISSNSSKQDDSDNDSDEVPAGKCVRFSNVDVRDYSLCLGDNPSVSVGAPISLDWDYDEEFSFEIDRYENERNEYRRDPEHLIIPSLQRNHMLQKSGYSREEIDKQTRKSQRDQQKRISSQRRAKRKDLIKNIVDGIASIVQMPSTRKTKVWYLNGSTKTSHKRILFVSDGDTLGCSGSTIATDSGFFPSDELIIAEDSLDCEL